MVVVENLAPLGKRSVQHVPLPVRTVADQRDAHAPTRHQGGDFLEVRCDLLGAGQPMPAHQRDDALSCRKQIESQPLDLLPEFLAPFLHQARPPALEHQPVISDVPALILAGEYDPVTPPDYGHQVTGHLSRAQFFELRAPGHGRISFATPATLSPPFPARSGC